jgi:hypothetical protein
MPLEAEFIGTFALIFIGARTKPIAVSVTVDSLQTLPGERISAVGTDFAGPPPISPVWITELDRRPLGASETG